MPVWEAVRLALHMIWAQKMKSAFSVIGVFVGVTFLIAVVTVVEGMNSYMRDDFAGVLLGVNTFELRQRPNVQMGNTSEETRRAWRRRPRITYDDAHAIRDKLTTPALVGWQSEIGATVRYRNRDVEGVRVTGASANFFDIKSLTIERGRAFSQYEVQASRPVVVIGSELANQLFGNDEPLGNELNIRGIPYRVVGVVEEQGNVFGISLDKFAVAPATSPVKRFANPAGIVDGVTVKAATIEEMQNAMAEAEAIMRSRRGLRPREESDFTLQTADAVLDFWDQIYSVMMIALPGLVGISLVVGGIVIMNIMLMSVSERTREIGIRKSLGARRKDILRQFLVESATLATVGAALGVATGLLLARLVDASTWLPASVAPWSIVVGVLLGAGVGIIAGVYPAGRASRLDPVVAMRQE
jgi:putative ABC transport system permease protein